MAIVKRFYAIIKMGKVEFTGFIGWLGWLVVHVGFLQGTRAKLVSMVNWVINATSRSRYALNSTDQQRKGRAALELLDEA